jgi:response regulator NasT
VHAALLRLEERPAAPPPPPMPPALPPVAPALRDQSVAVGILMERLRLDYAHALDVLRAQARAEGRDVEELASTMVDAANRLNSVPR